MEQSFSVLKDSEQEIFHFETGSQSTDNLYSFLLSVPLTATKTVIIMWLYNSLCNALQHQLSFIQKYFSLLKWFICNILIVRTLQI